MVSQLLNPTPNVLLSSFSTGGYFEKGLNFVFLGTAGGWKVVPPSLRFIQSPAGSASLGSHLLKLISYAETTNQNMPGKNTPWDQQRHHKDLSKCHIIFHLSLICSVLGGVLFPLPSKDFQRTIKSVFFRGPKPIFNYTTWKGSMASHSQCIGLSWSLLGVAPSTFGTDKVSEVPCARRRKLWIPSHLTGSFIRFRYS